MITPTYELGDWYAVIADGAVALLPPTMTNETVNEVWLALRENPDPTHCLTALVQGNLIDLPSFAIASVAAGAMRGFVHGDVGLSTTTAVGTQVHSGADVVTWAEIVVSDIESVTLRAPSRPEAADLDSPGVGGLAALNAVVLASRVDLRVCEDNDAGIEGAQDAPAVRSPGRPAGLGVEGSPRRVARRLAEPSLDDVAETFPPRPVGTKLGSLTLPVPGLLAAKPAPPALADKPAPASATQDSLSEPEQDVAAAKASEPRTVKDRVCEVDVPEGEQALAPQPPLVAPEVVEPPESSDSQRSEASTAASPSAPHVPGIVPVDVVPEVSEVGPAPLPPVEESSVPNASAAQTQILPQADLAKASVPKLTIAPTQVLPQPAQNDADTPDDDIHGATVLSAELVEIRRQLKNRKQGPFPGPIAVAAVPLRGPSLHMSSGEVVLLDRPVLIGRAPSAARVSARDRPHLVTVESRTRDISRTHAEVRFDGEEVLVTDLNSTNGLMLAEPGQSPRRLHAGEPTPLPIDAVIDLGDGITFRLERD
jgi:resuscitation-promoting factor RpfA